jgi:uncharacterized ferredoxin-like protein
MMYTVGAAVKDLNLLDSEMISRIPLSSIGENQFFDAP